MNNETIEKELKKQTGEQREQNTNQVWPVLGYEFGFLCREGLPFAQKQPQEAKEGTERTQHPNAHTYKHMLACASIRCAMGNKGSQKQAVDAPVAESRDTAAMVSEAASVPLPASPRTSITNTSKPAKLDDSWIGVAVAVLHTCEIECMALSLSRSPSLACVGQGGMHALGVAPPSLYPLLCSLLLHTEARRSRLATHSWSKFALHA